jgi:amino acid permease
MSVIQKKRDKKDRQALYFDLICGIVSSILALTGIFFVAITQKIRNMGMFITGASFWILYLILSIFLIGMGVYLWYKEKHWDEEKSRKDLKPPIY